MLDLPLGSTASTARWAVTENIVGAPAGDLTRAQIERAMALDGVHLHLYGKEARPGRKIGHLTVLGDDLDTTRSRARAAAAIINGDCQND